MQIQLNERDEAASTFISASKCYKKCNFEGMLHFILIFMYTIDRSNYVIYVIDAITSLKRAIEILTDRGRFQAAAGHQKEIAQIYESDLVDIEKAMQAYEIAAEWYAGEEANAYVLLMLN